MWVHLGASVFGAAIFFAGPSAEIAAVGPDNLFASEAPANSGSAGVANSVNARTIIAGLDPRALSVVQSLPALSDEGALDPQKRNAAASGASIVGMASTYNPYRAGALEGGAETASGEPYDPNSWTAAIQIDLRDKFGGVQHGDAYRPSYALVESVDKRVILKINDVGSLKPGRVIDLNEQTMRYFDPTLEVGLIDKVTVTPLLGDDWLPGPIEGEG